MEDNLPAHGWNARQGVACTAVARWLDGAVKTERYVDMDLVSVEGERLALKDERRSMTPWMVGGLLVGLVMLVLAWIVFGTAQNVANQNHALRMPQEVTPFLGGYDSAQICAAVHEQAEQRRLQPPGRRNWSAGTALLWPRRCN